MTNLIFKYFLFQRVYAEYKGWAKLLHWDLYWVERCWGSHWVPYLACFWAWHRCRSSEDAGIVWNTAHPTTLDTSGQFSQTQLWYSMKISLQEHFKYSERLLLLTWSLDWVCLELLLGLLKILPCVEQERRGNREIEKVGSS